MAGPEPVTPFLHQLLTYVQQAFSLYGVKSTLILVDTIGTIADIVGDALADRSLVALYFPKLMEKFVELEDDDMRLFPILECLTSVVAASGLECQPYAHGLYFRCLRIIGNTMAANAIADAKVIFKCQYYIIINTQPLSTQHHCQYNVIAPCTERESCILSEISILPRILSICSSFAITSSIQ